MEGNSGYEFPPLTEELLVTGDCWERGVNFLPGDNSSETTYAPINDTTPLPPPLHIHAGNVRFKKRKKNEEGKSTTG